MTLTEFMQIIMGFIGTIGFGILFNIKGIRLVYTSLGGLMSWTLYIILGYFIVSEPIRYFIVAAGVTIYAELMARKLKTPTTTMLMTTLVPLIPGSSLYYTMNYALGSDSSKFVSKGVFTLKLAGALALGIVMTSMVARVINRTLVKNNR